MKARIATIIAAVALAACAGTNFDWSQVEQIKPGMTTEQVVQIMGKPDTVFSSPGGVIYGWSHVNTLAASAKSVSVRFVDGKVAEAPTTGAYH